MAGFVMDRMGKFVLYQKIKEKDDTKFEDIRKMQASSGGNNEFEPVSQRPIMSGI